MAINILTITNNALLEMLIVAQLAKTFYLFSGTQIFITMRDFRFPQRSYWRFWSSVMLRYVANANVNRRFWRTQRLRIQGFVRARKSFHQTATSPNPVPVESIPTFPFCKLFHPHIFLTSSGVNWQSACISIPPAYLNKRLLHPPTFCHPNNIQWTVQIIKFFIM